MTFAGTPPCRRLRTIERGTVGVSQKAVEGATVALRQLRAFPQQAPSAVPNQAGTSGELENSGEGVMGRTSTIATAFALCYCRSPTTSRARRWMAWAMVSPSSNSKGMRRN